MGGTEQRARSATGLDDLIRRSESWLMERVLAYAKEQGYTKYTSTLLEAWRISIEGLSTSLVEAYLQASQPHELTPDEDFLQDPAAAFGILEAQRHRTRGVNLAMFLGLMKYYRQSYFDLLYTQELEADRCARWQLFVCRYFDRVELGFCSEWMSISETEKTAELQSRNREMTNEKNKYLTVFESLHDPVILLDASHRIENLNHAAAVLLLGEDASGSMYYQRTASRDILPWLEDELVSLAEGVETERTLERTFETPSGVAHFSVRIKRMLDVSEKFAGTVILLTDVSERVRHQEELAYLATHDSLTGLYNRHYLHQMFEHEIQRTRRYGNRLGVLMLDVNRLKRVNDRFGHQQGDEILKELGGILREHLRASDVAVRYGGDEFLLLLPEADENSLQELARRIEVAVQLWYEREKPVPFPIRFSIGATVWTEKQDLDLHEVIAIADSQMYRNKRERLKESSSN